LSTFILLRSLLRAYLNSPDMAPLGTAADILLVSDRFASRSRDCRGKKDHDAGEVARAADASYNRHAAGKATASPGKKGRTT
jgi:hypothetical protein